MTCHHKPDSACPFARTEASEYASNAGCLPSIYEIRVMRAVHGKTWACHEHPEQACSGAIQDLRKEGLPYRVIDPVLLTEQSPWHHFVDVVGPRAP